MKSTKLDFSNKKPEDSRVFTGFQGSLAQEKVD